MTFTPNDRFDIIHKGEYHRIFDTDTCHALPRVMLSMDSKDGKCRVCMYVNPMIPMMYDGAEHFDKYLEDVKGMFRFK